jgi:hypothetical protein
MGVIDEAEFAQKYFRAVSRGIERSTERLVRVLKELVSFRPGLTASFDRTGAPTFSLTVAPGEGEMVLQEVLELPYRPAAHRGTPVGVVLDEFQEVARLGIEGALRSVIQHHGTHVAYLFLGSKKSILKQLFLDKSNPLYRSVKHLPLGGIDSEEWMPFIRRGFHRNGKRIAPEIVEELLSVSLGFPYYTQQIAHELFALSGEEVREKDLTEAVESVLAKEEELFLTEWEMLSGNQKRAVRLITQGASTGLYNRERMEQDRLTASSLKKALDGLLAKDIIDRVGEHWYLQDPLFAYFVRERL